MRMEIKEEELYLDNQLLGRIDTDPYDKCKYSYEFKNEIDLNKILQVKKEDLLEDCTFHALQNDIIYIIEKKNEIASISLCEIISLDDWNYEVSPNKYCSLFLDIVEVYYEVFVEDGNLFIQTPEFEIEEKILIREKVKQIKEIIDEINNKILFKNKIFSSLKFSPEHLSAGSSILQYFGKLLQERYPDENVAVSIKQEGLKVTMIIETPEGKKEEIEEYLNRYGMVVTNQITPQEFTSNPIQVLELETKLGQAEQEIKFQKKLLALQDKTYDENLTSMKDEIKYLRNELFLLRASNSKNMELLLSSLLKKDKLINKLSKSIEKRDDKETKKLLLELKEKDSKGYVSLKEHIDNIIINNLSNVPGWMSFIAPYLPK